MSAVGEYCFALVFQSCYFLMVGLELNGEHRIYLSGDQISDDVSEDVRRSRGITPSVIAG